MCTPNGRAVLGPVFSKIAGKEDHLQEEEIRCNAAETTMVQKLFGGILSLNYKCSKCNTKSTNTEHFLDLQLSFPSLVSKNQFKSGGIDASVSPPPLLVNDAITPQNPY